MQNVVSTEGMAIPDLSNAGREHRGAGVQGLAVLVQDAANKFACYVGLVARIERPEVFKSAEEETAFGRLICHRNQMVACAGRKLPHREALRYFPSLPANEYRD